MLEWDDERATQWKSTRHRAESVKTEIGRTKRDGKICVFGFACVCALVRVRE